MTDEQFSLLIYQAKEALKQMGKQKIPPIVYEGPRAYAKFDLTQTLANN